MRGPGSKVPANTDRGGFFNLFFQLMADRQPLTAHDADYQAARKDWESFVVSLSEKISEIDSTIPELPAKDLVSAINFQLKKWRARGDVNRRKEGTIWHGRKQRDIY